LGKRKREVICPVLLGAMREVNIDKEFLHGAREKKGGGDDKPKKSGALKRGRRYTRRVHKEREQPGRLLRNKMVPRRKVFGSKKKEENRGGTTLTVNDT